MSPDIVAPSFMKKDTDDDKLAAAEQRLLDAAKRRLTGN
jgi:hypothetical protein